MSKDSSTDSSASSRSPASVSARLLHYFGEGLKQPDFDAAAWWLVSRFSTILPADRVVLLGVTKKKAKLIASDSGVENVAISGFVDAATKTLKAAKAAEKSAVEVWGCHDSGAALVEEISKANGGSSVAIVPFTSAGKYWVLWLERWHGVYWQAAEVSLLERFPEYLSAILADRSASSNGRGRKLALLALLVFLLFPVRDDVAAEAMIVPSEPHTVFSALDGIVKSVAVRNGQQVSIGQELFAFDDELLRRELEEIRGEWGVALAEQQRLEAAAYQDANARAQLKVQNLNVEQARLRAESLQVRLDKVLVNAKVAGAVDLEGRDGLVGAYLRTGEKVFRIVDENDLRAELFVPIADVGRFAVGAEVGLRLNNKPFEVVLAEVESVGLNVVISDKDVPSVKVLASISEKTGFVRTGVQGSAAIRAGWTVMAARLLRKPFAYITSFLGV